MEKQVIRCCMCKGFATQIIYDNGWSKPSCETCWPLIDVLKLSNNHPVSGELICLT